MGARGNCPLPVVSGRLEPRDRGDQAWSVLIDHTVHDGGREEARQVLQADPRAAEDRFLRMEVRPDVRPPGMKALKLPTRTRPKAPLNEREAVGQRDRDTLRDAPDHWDRVIESHQRPREVEPDRTIDMDDEAPHYVWLPLLEPPLPIQLSRQISHVLILEGASDVWCIRCRTGAPVHNVLEGLLALALPRPIPGVGCAGWSPLRGPPRHPGLIPGERERG